MPFYNWNGMARRRLASASDSEGSMIIGDMVTLNRSVSKPGKSARPHSHLCEQIIQVVEGSAWFRVGNEEKTVMAGDIIHIPPGAIHEFKNSGNADFVYVSFKNKTADWPPAGAVNDAHAQQP